MSDQQKEQDRAERRHTGTPGQAAGAGPAVAEPASGPIDSAATAALALAVTSAKRAASSPPRPGTSERASPRSERPHAPRGQPRMAYATPPLRRHCFSPWRRAGSGPSCCRRSQGGPALDRGSGSSSGNPGGRGPRHGRREGPEGVSRGAQGWPRSFTHGDAYQANPCDRSDRAARAGDRDQPIFDRMTQLAAQLERIEAAAEDPE